MKGNPLETEYVRGLLARAPIDLPDVRLFRRPAGGVLQVASGQWIRTGVLGQCDLYALAKGGRHYEIEVKRFGRLSEAQARWREWCAKWAIPWLLLEVRKGEVPPETIHRWISELRDFFLRGSGHPHTNDTVTR